MAGLAIVAGDPELERRLKLFLHELHGKIDHAIPYPNGGTEFWVSIPDDNLKFLKARMALSGGFRWR
jgi:hypothetical protein